MYRNPLFPRRLAEAIARSGHKKGDVARQSGLAPITLSRYLSGKIQASETALRSLATVLHVDPEWLAGRSGSPPLTVLPDGSHHSFVAEALPRFSDRLFTTVNSLDAVERVALEQFLRGLTSRDQAVRMHLIGQMKIIDRALGRDEAEEASGG